LPASLRPAEWNSFGELWQNPKIKVEAFSGGPSSRVFYQKIAQVSKLFLPSDPHQANGFQTLREKSMICGPKKLTIKMSASISK
jgi:hypothetical protein